MQLDIKSEKARRLAEVRAIQANVATALANAGQRAPNQAELDRADYDADGLPWPQAERP